MIRVAGDLVTLVVELVDAVAQASDVIEMLASNPRYPMLALGTSLESECEDRVVILPVDGCFVHAVITARTR